MRALHIASSKRTENIRQLSLRSNGPFPRNLHRDPQAVIQRLYCAENGRSITSSTFNHPLKRYNLSRRQPLFFQFNEKPRTALQISIAKTTNTNSIAAASYSTSPLLSQSLINLPPCDSINLLSLIPDQTLQTVRTLPEVEKVLSSLKNNPIENTKPILEGLNRAIQIFQHVGDQEYKSILILKATYLSQKHQYHDAIEVLSLILSMEEAKDSPLHHQNKFLIISSLLKMHWYCGSFNSSLEYANLIHSMASSRSPSVETVSETTEQQSLKQGCAMNALALSQLLIKDKLQDVDVQKLKLSGDIEKDKSIKRNQDIMGQKEWNNVLDAQNTLKESSKLLETTYLTSQLSPHIDKDLQIQLVLACASSYCNEGVVDLISNIIQNEQNNLETTGYPYESAIITWKKALNFLDELEQSKQPGQPISIYHTYLWKITKARIYCNMAWAILFYSSYTSTDLNPQPLKEEELKDASEYSSIALKLFDEIIVMGNNHSVGDNEDIKHMMGRALGIVATCYARAGSAVTAEGLLQSAIDLYKEPNKNVVNHCPISLINSRSIFFYYSTICSNWEKRDSDAKKNKKMALKINNAILVKNWRDISTIYGGLWLFTISDF